MPFSRGNVHISSTDPKAYPQINPTFFLVDFDLQVQIAIAKWTRNFWATEPMSSLITMEISPGYSVLPENATDAEWAEWAKSLHFVQGVDALHNNADQGCEQGKKLWEPTAVTWAALTFW